MKIRMSKNVILTTALGVFLLGGTNGLQYYLWTEHSADKDIEYAEQISALQLTIEEVGPLVDIYRLVDKGEAGHEITQENLMLSQIPESMLTDAYVLDPYEVEGKFYKIDMQAESALTTDVVMEEEMKDSIRETDIVTNTRPSGLEVGDYIDVELVMPSGQKYVVAPKKRIYSITGTSVKLVMDATERHMYHSALVDYFLEKEKGSMLQMAKYIDPGVQQAAQVYYSPSKSVLAIMQIDPNIGESLSTAILESRRSLMDDAIAKLQGEINEERNEKLVAGADEVIEKLELAYEEYNALVAAAQEAGGTEDDFYVPEEAVTDPYALEEEEAPVEEVVE